MRISDWSSDVCSSDLWTYYGRRYTRKRSGTVLGRFRGMPRHLEAQLQAPACRRQALIMRVEQVALKEKAGQRQPLGHRTGPTLATADQEARQRQQLLPIRSPGRERYGTAGARTNVGQLIVVAPGRAAGQVEPQAPPGAPAPPPAEHNL